jgi:hypothetical protein
LNCGAEIAERYCSRCGQEKIHAKESFGQLAAHFFSDVTHFDSKVFLSIKDLILRPGFLTKEYIAGKRVRYLNPIRMYLFLSALFFLVAFAGSDKPARVEDNGLHSTNLFRQELADSLRRSAKSNPLKSKEDSFKNGIFEELASRLDSAELLTQAGESFGLYFSSDGILMADLVENKFRNLKEYDSVQRTLPDSLRDRGVLKWLLRNNLRLKARNGNRSHIRLEQDIRHDIPKIMFVLMPLFALFVGWFYSRKKFLYWHQVMFSVHFHSFVFLLFLVILLLEKIVPGDFAGIVLLVLSLLATFLYLVAALKGMYAQSYWISFFKAIAVSLLYIIALILVLGLLSIISFIAI